MERSWVVVVPVKRLHDAKSRLAEHLGARRRDLALAMALDTITAAASCRHVRVVVVTDDVAVARALRGSDIPVVTGEPHGGINAALRHGAQAASVGAGEGVAALAADLPALRPAELSLALNRATGELSSFVPDTAGTGTTLYAATASDRFDPSFGLGSAVAHAVSATALDVTGLASLRSDVDTVQDLRVAVALGLRPRSARVVAELLGTVLVLDDTVLDGVDVPLTYPAA